MNPDETSNDSGIGHLEPELLERGINQIRAEIDILQSWLDSLDLAEDEPRRTYEDMLRSRREMLATLQEQQARYKNT